MKLRNVLTIVAALCIAMTATACSGADTGDEPSGTSDASSAGSVSSDESEDTSVTFAPIDSIVVRDDSFEGYMGMTFHAEDAQELLTLANELYQKLSESPEAAEGQPETIFGGGLSLEFPDGRRIYVNGELLTLEDGRQFSSEGFKSELDDIREKIISLPYTLPADIEYSDILGNTATIPYDSAVFVINNVLDLVAVLEPDEGGYTGTSDTPTISLTADNGTCIEIFEGYDGVILNGTPYNAGKGIILTEIPQLAVSSENWSGTQTSSEELVSALENVS